MLNRSKTYLAPLVLKDIPEIFFRNVENTYIFSDFNCLEPFLYLEIKRKTMTEEQLIELLKKDIIKDCFSINDKYLVLIDVKSKNHFEYLCFKRGHYSWYTNEAKIAIINYLLENTNERTHRLIEKVKSVLSKDPMLKKYYEKILDITLEDESELGERMEEEKETFKSVNYDNFQQLERGYKV